MARQGHSKRKWIQKALKVKPRRLGKGRHHRKSVRKVAAHRGALHRMLKVSVKKKIPLRKLRWAAKQPGLLGKRARFALNVRRK
jgi:hypothetical protein